MRFYICNGENPDCAKTHCFYHGGECKYTTNEQYRLNSESIFERVCEDEEWEVDTRS